MVNEPWWVSDHCRTNFWTEWVCNSVTVAQPLSPKHVTFALFQTDRPLPSFARLDFASCLFSFNPHLVVLRPSFRHSSFRCYRTTFNGHHSDCGITSLLVHSMRRTSMPRGSSFPFHPTTIDPFSLLFDTACTNTLGRLNLVPVSMDRF